MKNGARPAEIAALVGGRLKRLRDDYDLTQVQLAARIQSLGMERGGSAKTISAWECGDTPLPLTALPVLASAFRMEPGVLARRLGICGEAGHRDLVIAEATETVNQLADEPPHVADTILRWLRESVEIARSARLGRQN